jgi:hypothetical protein
MHHSSCALTSALALGLRAAQPCLLLVQQALYAQANQGAKPALVEALLALLATWAARCFCRIRWLLLMK